MRPAPRERSRSPEHAAVLDGAMRDLGARIRALRVARRKTLQQVAEATGLSPSMLSMVERGQANPSIGSLMAIAGALGVSMARLFGDGSRPTTPVVRAGEQMVMTTRRGVRRRLLIRDDDTSIEVAENTYAPGTASADSPIRHLGREMGVLIEGTLAVEVGGERYLLEAGDAVVFDSTRPHRFVNVGRRTARTLWINVHGTRWVP